MKAVQTFEIVPSSLERRSPTAGEDPAGKTDQGRKLVLEALAEVRDQTSLSFFAGTLKPRVE